MAVDARPQNGELLGPSFDHLSWQCSHAGRARWRPLSEMVLRGVRVCGVWHGLHGASGAFSLGGGR